MQIANKYIGTISTRLQEIHLNENGSGRHYIYGYVEIKEKVEGQEQIPQNLPNLTLKGEEGYSQTMYVSDSGNGLYYFDTYIEDIDKEQSYYIEAKLTGSNNIATEENKTKKLEIDSQTLGKMEDLKVVVENSNIEFIEADKYIGTISTRLQEIHLNENESGRHYIYGYVEIKEKVEGQEQIPQNLPGLTLKGEDGYSQTMYVSDSGNGLYYFDTYIEDVDKEQGYYIEARLTGSNNTATEEEKTSKI